MRPELCVSSDRSVTSSRSWPRHSGIHFRIGSIQRERAALDEPHHEARRRDHFRQRREIENRVCSAWGRVGIVVEPAKRLLPQHLAARADFDDGGRKRALLDAALHNVGGAGEIAHGANASFATVSTYLPSRLSYENSTIPSAPSCLAARMFSTVADGES